MLFISPPFGNYFKTSGVKRIKGTYTIEKRSGLLSQIVKTLRYSVENGGWTNAIGLRNPGIATGVRRYNHETDILSIAVRTSDDVDKFLKVIPENANIELNISCPNIQTATEAIQYDKFINSERKWCIVKVSPLTNTEDLDKLYKMGFRQFHCCNTLPSKEGGLSGPSLVPYVTKLIKQIKTYPDTVIIAGGGIQNFSSLKEYKALGADHFSISTIFFHPIKVFRFCIDYKE
jgi:dihydroorotate dehydrogenase